MPELVTVGHGNLALDVLIGNLRGAGVGRLVDVRSTPYSRWHPQFNRKSIEAASTAAGIAYEWEPALGGRPDDPALRTPGGEPDYELMAEHPPFLEASSAFATAEATPDVREGRHRGVTPTAIRVLRGPPEGERCHRTLLVTPALLARGASVRHLLKDGSVLDDAPRAMRLL